MNGNPLISVIIPTYNRANELKRALMSVQAQSYTNWEVIIVDNHSSDHTDKVVSAFNEPRIKLCKINNNGVIAASRNMGIRESLGDYIAFLDSDDWWMPQKLSVSFSALASGADLIYHDLFLVTKPKHRFIFRKVATRALKVPVFFDLLELGNGITNSSVVVRKSLLTSIDGLSEDCNLTAIEDYECLLRIALLTDKFVRVPRTLGYYWAGGNNTSNPKRVIYSIDAFVRLYYGPNRLSEHLIGDWVHYSCGRAYYVLKNFELAKKRLSMVSCTVGSFRFYIRSQWMINIMIVRHNWRRLLDSRRKGYLKRSNPGRDVD
jgi:glycosyltransferase involved in cell wall biosynthesis